MTTDEIAQVFRQFADALLHGSNEEFRAVAAEDVMPQEDLFQRNSARLRERGWKLRLRAIDQQGDAAEVQFDVEDAQGAVKDRGRIVLTLEAQGWRIREL